MHILWRTQAVQARLGLLIKEAEITAALNVYSRDTYWVWWRNTNYDVWSREIDDQAEVWYSKSSAQNKKVLSHYRMYTTLMSLLSWGNEMMTVTVYSIAGSGDESEG